MSGKKITASADHEYAGDEEFVAKLARKHLIAANWLALIMQKCKAESIAAAFRDLMLLCQLFWRWGELRTGEDGLVYDHLVELYADTFHEAL